MLLRDVPDRTKSEYKQAAKQYGSERTLSGPEADKVIGMQETAHARVPELLQPALTEVSLFAKCPKTGLMMKARFDWLADGHGIDVKKTQDVRASELAKSITNYRYHVQEQFYSYVYELVTGEPLKSFRFLFIEEEMPHAVVLAPLDALAREIGRTEMWRNLETVVQCESNKEWPQPEQPAELSVTNWCVSQYEDSLEVEDIE